MSLKTEKSTKIIPANYDKDYCIICNDEDKSAVDHNCNICKKHTWKICNDCNDKLTICPMCRTPKNPLNPNTTINITINTQVPSNLSNINQRNILNNSRNRPTNNTYNDICSDNCKEFIYIIRIPMLFILSIYIGKVYITIYCKGTCDTKHRFEMKNNTLIDNCQCYSYANRDNYWGDFSHCIFEFLIGFLGSVILYGCCCVKNNT